MNEGGYIQKTNRSVKLLNSSIRIWKISDRFTRSVPDVRYSGPKARLYVEYKWVNSLPKHATVKPNLSEGQKQWLRDEAALGVNVAVVVGSPEGAVLYKDLSWESPVPAQGHVIPHRSLAEYIVRTTV